MRASRPSSVPSARPLALLGLSLAAVLVSGCSSADDSSSTAEAAAASDEFGHIHSLDVDPTDGTLYVASHQGLFALGADGFERVGEGRFDAMSFAIAGPDRFLMSGHPEPGSGKPAHLGLSESTDKGRTWSSSSLEGEADFHALEPAGDRVYGVDSQSGSLLLTEDGARWQTLGQLPAADVAAHPGDPDLLLLTDGRGALVRLEVAGRPELVDTAPRLVLLDWVEEDLLVGVGPEGAVHRSTDGGESWSEAGALGAAPHALTATDAAWYAATDTGVLVSEDGGASWSQVAPG